MFRKYGNVVDTFIARKRSASGKRFGFARFVGVKDEKTFEKKLNEIWIGTFKLRVNLAKFCREKVLANRLSKEEANKTVV